MWRHNCITTDSIFAWSCRAQTLSLIIVWFHSPSLESSKKAASWYRDIQTLDTEWERKRRVRGWSELPEKACLCCIRSIILGASYWWVPEDGSYCHRYRAVIRNIGRIWTTLITATTFSHRERSSLLAYLTNTKFSFVIETSSVGMPANASHRYRCHVRTM